MMGWFLISFNLSHYCSGSHLLESPLLWIHSRVIWKSPQEKTRMDVRKNTSCDRKNNQYITLLSQSRKPSATVPGKVFRISFIFLHSATRCSRCLISFFVSLLGKYETKSRGKIVLFKNGRQYHSTRDSTHSYVLADRHVKDYQPIPGLYSRYLLRLLQTPL